MYKINCLILLFLIDIIVLIQSQEWNLSNLNSKCLRCLCEAATGCKLERRCSEEIGYCGPYKIAKVYWEEAGNITLPTDDYRRAGAYQDCSNDYFCARKIIKGYLAKFAQDCNDDGVTDCYDFMMVNFNGAYGCKKPLDRNSFGRMWLERYTACMKLTEVE